MDPQSRGLATAFASATLPAALQPSEKDRVFTVALLWQGTQLVDVARLDASRSGAKPIPLAHEILPRTLLPRVQSLPGGEVALLVPNDAPVQVIRGEVIVPTSSLIAAGEAEPIQLPVRGFRYVLKPEERFVITSGQVQLVGRYLRSEPVARRPLQDRMDPIFLSMLTIGAIAIAFVLGIFRLALSAGPVVDDDQLMKRPPHMIVTAQVPPPPPVRQPSALGGDVPKQAGRDDHPPRQGGLQHGKPNRNPLRLGAQVESFFTQLDAAAATGQVLAGSGNTALNVALGGVHADSTAMASGFEGIDSRGGPAGTGGHGLTVGRIGSPDGLPGGRIPEGLRLAGHGKTVFDPPSLRISEGGLDKDVVGRIIRRHWNEIRYCYEKELNKDPNLAGKVAMHFQIGPNGEVLSADVSDTTLGNKSAEECMLGNVKRWVFPHPKGGGLVEVNYPFLFQSTH